jgi:heparan-alpha-glucosaminide N-acetyltransferase
MSNRFRNQFDQASDSEPAVAKQRLLSLDVYRGAVMLLLATNAFGIAKIAKSTDAGDNGLIAWLGFQASHPDWISQFRWIGFSLWDMIQPAFMFIVGVAVPYSYAKRTESGASRLEIFRHAWGRALILILLGVFLQSMRVQETNWLFTNVLCQIGLGYGFLILLAGRSYLTQATVGIVVLVSTWLLFVSYPIQSASVEAEAKGVLSGFFGHWSMNANVAWAFDRWFLNLFPRSQPWELHPGGYHTLNFVPAFVTMLMGLMCGQLLRDERYRPEQKLLRMSLAGVVLLAISVLLSVTLCPIVKRLWTPSWALFSGAYVIWLLALFYWVIDQKGWKGWTFPFVVVGMNPLAMFMMSSSMHGWVAGQLQIHLPSMLFESPWGYAVEAALTALVFWLVCFWMYRRNVFLRI